MGIHPRSLTARPMKNDGWKTSRLPKMGPGKISGAILKLQGVIYRGHLNLTHFWDHQMYGNFEGFPLSTLR